MKFGKEFVSQMVPEWQEAYMNYNHLKKLLKDIHVQKQRNRPASAPTLVRNISRYRPFSGLLHRHDIEPVEVGPASPDLESQAILVHAVNRAGSKTTRYETTFLMTSEKGGEYELVFFRRLDDEFYKVEKFYKSKVDEVLLEAEELNKQMDALIAFRIKVENPSGLFDRKAEMERLSFNVSASTATLSASAPYAARASASRRVHVRMDSINEDLSIHKLSLDDQQQNENESEKSHEKVGVQKMELSIVPVRTPAMEVLNNVTFHNHLETPRSTIKGFLKIPKHTELSFTHENLKRVEDKLKRAFVEFYQKLRLLKNFNFLNTEAFSKIMKKYDKITSRNAAIAYMNMVDNSYLGSSEEVSNLMERVENAFIKHFANSNRSKGMRVLRPKAKKERHTVSFSMGFFAGCTAALIIALILMVRARHILNHPGTSEYMETLFPLYSLFGFVVLHMLLYAGNIYYWRKYRVNYTFIFGFKQGTELGYREVLLMSFALAVGALVCVLANLDMEMDPKTNQYQAFTELLPLNLVFIVFIVMFCPFNVLYRSSRFFFLKSLLRSILAPLYKVTLPDFVLADQLTSQVQAFRSFEFYICYYGWGDYKHRKNTCSDNDVFNVFYFIVAVIPYWSRLFQCIRRLVEEKDGMQGWNALKYFLTIVAVCLRTAFSLNKGLEWEVVAWVFSIAAAMFCTYWDFVHDWGLLNRKSKNRWLRDRLLVPRHSIYYGAMVLNVLLRFAWLQTVLELRVFSLHRQTLTTIVASLEIIRRGIWTFFRLENEHLTNIGKFRAFKSVPLPFNYDEDDDKEE